MPQPTNLQLLKKEFPDLSAAELKALTKEDRQALADMIREEN